MSRQTAGDILLSTLRRTAAERNSILREAQDHPTQTTPTTTTFFDHVVHSFFEGSEERTFQHFNIPRALFDAALNLVDSVPLARRGRPSFVQTHKDKLLFLLIFLTNGTKALSMACLPRLNTPSAILHHIHEAANIFIDPLKRNTVLFLNEQAEGLPRVSSVVDCTVVEINGPDTPFRVKDVYYSGKHKRHCLKKEVVVNVRSGRAAMISEEYPGSVPDVEVLRRHSDEVNSMLGTSQMLADKGYRGDTQVPNCIVVSETMELEKRHRLIVERFFGRLKNYFVVFSKVWELSPRCLSTFFDIACAMTNVTILIPLSTKTIGFSTRTF